MFSKIYHLKQTVHTTIVMIFQMLFICLLSIAAHAQYFSSSDGASVSRIGKRNYLEHMLVSRTEDPLPPAKPDLINLRQYKQLREKQLSNEYMYQLLSYFKKYVK